MTAAPNGNGDLEQLVTRIARRAADAVSVSVADLGTQLALVRESLEGAVAALEAKDEQLAGKDAELARANQVSEELRRRIAELESPEPAATASEDSTEG